MIRSPSGISCVPVKNSNEHPALVWAGKGVHVEVVGIRIDDEGEIVIR
jgi:hypothetical protein